MLLCQRSSIRFRSGDLAGGRALSETRLPFGGNLYRAGIRRRILWVMGRAESKKGNLNLLLLPKEVVRFFPRMIQIRWDGCDGR